MTHLKSYLGSIVLAGLLLQGCGSDSSSASAPIVEDNTPSQAVASFTAVSDILSTESLSSEDSAQALSDMTLNMTALYASDAEVQAYVDSVVADNEEIITTGEAFKAIAEAIVSTPSDADQAPRRGVLSGLTDKIKDGLVDIMDTSVGDKITSATFDVVLNSEGVTVVMLDAARQSHTMSEIMVNALEADWDLTVKMCPMLRESTEFGEKFVALAEERDIIGRFFFERIDPIMYSCLTDAMLLSNNNAVHHDSVKYSTNGYMGLLMDRYATDYFIMPTGSTDVRRNDKFVGLMLDTGAITTYDSETKTFTGHGDANELTNEKFFYSLFKTPTSTDSFVSAMEKIDPAVKKMLMDNIFLGQPVDATAAADTVQGQLNIIAIGSAMYDGIYGEANADGVRENAYGFGSYMGAFVGFAALIPGDRYMTYGKAFVDAGYQYAAFHGYDVWDGISDAAQTAWNAYNGDETTTTETTAAQTAGLGITGSDWYDDIIDVMWAGWDNVSLSDAFDALMDENSSVMDTVNDQAYVVYGTLIDGRNVDGVQAYPTEIENDLFTSNDTVYGIHGLIELAMQEDIYNYNVEDNTSYTMDDARAAFTLPAFADLTFDFAYNTASDGVMAYYDNNIDGQEAAWLADLSNQDLIREYFYPSADNAYIPSWMLAIDWLNVPASVVNTDFAATDFDFNAGYFDVYVTSTKAELITEYAVALENINITKIDMSADSIIAVDENGQTLEGVYVYKIRAVSQEDLDAIFAAISELGDDALSAVGLDSSNASSVDTTDETTTSAE